MKAEFRADCSIVSRTYEQDNSIHVLSLMDSVASAHQRLVSSACKILEDGQSNRTPSKALIDDLEAARTGLHAACDSAVHTLVHPNPPFYTHCSLVHGTKIFTHSCNPALKPCLIVSMLFTHVLQDNAIKQVRAEQADTLASADTPVVPVPSLSDQLKALVGTSS